MKYENIERANELVKEIREFENELKSLDRDDLEVTIRVRCEYTVIVVNCANESLSGRKLLGRQFIEDIKKNLLACITDRKFKLEAL